MKHITIITVALLIILSGCSANAQSNNKQQQKTQDQWQADPSVVKKHESRQKDDSRPQCWGTVVDKRTHMARRCYNSSLEEYKDRAGHLYCYAHRNQAASR